MKVSEFFKSLDSIGDNYNIIFKSPDRKLLPLHFHVTEAAVVLKKFTDCGGFEREELYSTIQLWTSHDYNHRINAGKLRKIILNTLVANDKDMDLFVEHETDTLSLYAVESYEVIGETILYLLGNKKAQCLAPDQCGVNEGVVEKKCCQKSNCC